MGELAHAKSFRDSIVSKKSRAVAQEIFKLSKRLPEEELYSLTGQVRRSSRSIRAQIAEALAKRRYEKHIVSKLTDADGEQMETQQWIETAEDCGYLTSSQSAEINEDLAEIGRMVNSMMSKTDKFCS